MSNPLAQMEVAYSRMSQDLGSNLSHYYGTLQARFGDPRVYAAQQEQIRAQTAVIEYHETLSKSDALRLAYDRDRAQISEDHTNRIAARLNRHRSPPGPYQTPKPPAQTVPPPAQTHDDPEEQVSR